MKRVEKFRFLLTSMLVTIVCSMLFTTAAFAQSNVTVRMSDITKPSEVYQGAAYPVEFSFTASKPAGEPFEFGETFDIPTNIGDLFTSGWDKLNGLEIKNTEGKRIATLSFSPRVITVTIDEAAAGEVEFVGKFTSATIFRAKDVGATKDKSVEKQFVIGDATRDIKFMWRAAAPSNSPVDIDEFWKNASTIAPGNAARMFLEVNPIGSMDLYGYTSNPNPRKPQVWDNMVLKDVIPNHGFIDESSIQIYAAIPAVGQRDEDWIANTWYKVPAGTYYAQRQGTMRWTLIEDWGSIPAKMTRLYPEPGETAQQFEQRINDNPLTWGLYTAADYTQTFLCNFGRVGDPENNNGIMYETWMPNLVSAYPEIFGPNAPTGGNIVSYYVEFDTYYPDVVDGQKIQNNASLSGRSRGANYTVTADEGVGSVRRNNVRVKVVDAEDPATPIVGADFKLQVLKDGIWQDTKLSGATDSLGIAQFGPLPVGKYRLVQTSTLEGYEFDNMSFDSTGYDDKHPGGVNRVSATGEFEITLKDNFGFGSLVTNSRIYPAVSYEFVSDNTPFEIPEEVLAKLPANKTVDYGAEVAPDALAEKDQKVETADGTWTFLGWNAGTQTATSDITFTGTWRFETSWAPVNELPVITASDKTMYVGETFDPRADVSAMDAEDGDLTEAIEIVEDTVNPGAAGIYSVTYKVTDSAGMSVTKTINVEVIQQYTVSYKFVSNNGLLMLPSEVLAKLPASYKVEAGNVVNASAIEGADQVVTTAAGTWTFTGWDTESQIVNSDVTFTGTWTFESSWVPINHRPVIIASDKIINLGDEFDARAGVSARDAEDGDLTEAIEIVEDTVNPAKPGMYTVTYKVVDSAGASATKTVNVEVIGLHTVSYQFISNNAAFELPAEVLAKLPASYEVNDGVEVTPQMLPITSQTVVTADGTWTFVAWNPTSQVATSDITFTGTWRFETSWSPINQRPEISASDKTMYVGESFDPRADVSAMDAEDGDLTEAIEIVENTVDPDVAGTYSVTYKVVDSAGVSDTKTISVEVLSLNTVSYEFVSNNEAFTLPAEVLAKLPASQGVKPGTTVTPKMLPMTDQTVETFAGTWVFLGWDQDSQVADTDVVFTGTWRFETSMSDINHLPVIDASDRILYVGDPFDPLEGVTATDVEDGDLTGSVEVYLNTVNPDVPGAYTIRYTVTDSLGGTSSKIIGVTVIQQHTVSYQFVSNNAAIKVPAEVLAKLPASYKVDSGTKVVPQEIVATNQVVETATGTWYFDGWDLESQVVDTDVVFIGTWHFETALSPINHLPVITAPDRIIFVGDPFNPMEGVSASDYEDGDLTSSIEIYLNTVDTTTPGAYTVRYQVTDSFGGTTYKTMGVTVLQQHWVSYQFVCENPAIELPAEVYSLTPASYEAIAGAIAVPENPASTTVTTDAGVWTFMGWAPTTQRVDQDVVFTGTWHFEADLVEINHPPVISASDMTIYVGDGFDPYSGVSASDYEDGDISASVVVEENTVNPSVAGEYYVTYSVVDSAGIRAVKSISVTVIQLNQVSYTFESNNAAFELPADVLAFLPSGATVEAGTVVTPTDLAQKIVPVENGMWVFDGWSSDSEVANSDVIFTGTWHFECAMPAINTVPVISAEDMTIYVGDAFDPMDGVSATDAEDGDVTAAIEIVKNDVDSSAAGSYTVTFKVTDSEGAMSYKTIVVVVLESEVAPEVPDTPGDVEKPQKPEKTENPQLPVTADTFAVGALFVMMSGVACMLAAAKHHYFEK